MVLPVDVLSYVDVSWLLLVPLLGNLYNGMDYGDTRAWLAGLLGSQGDFANMGGMYGIDMSDYAKAAGLNPFLTGEGFDSRPRSGFGVTASFGFGNGSGGGFGNGGGGGFKWQKLLAALAGAAGGLQGSPDGADLSDLTLPPSDGSVHEVPGGGRRRRPRGGGGGGRGGGGGGGVNRGDLFAQYLAQLQSGYGTALAADPLGGALLGIVGREALPENDLRADPRWQEALFGLNSELASRGGRLADLDPATLAQLEQMTSAERGMAQRQFEDTNNSLLAAAFAGGNQQSTVFGDTAGRASRDQALVLGQIEAAGNQRNIDLRKSLAEQYLQSAALRRDALTSGGQLNLDELQAMLAQRNQRASLLQAAQDRAMSLTQGARSAEEFDRDLALRNRQISLDAQIRRAQVNVQRQELMYRDQWFQQEQAFNRDQFLEQIRQFNAGWELDRRSLDLGYTQWRRERSDASRNAWLSTAATLFASFSDARLKEDVRVIGDPLDLVKEIDGVVWKWAPELGANPGPEAGVLAQDLERVLPQAVLELPSGAKVVSYQGVVGLLVESVKALSAEVDRLKARVGEE